VISYFKRQVLKELLRWKNSSGRKPLVLRGARQVGKTISVRMLAEEYDDYIELNLERQEDAALFKKNLPFDQVVESIRIRGKYSGKDQSLLVFIDEIQACPEAVAALRFFYEDRPDIHVVAAGSLLEVALEKARISFPVGRVEFLYLNPLNFIEFLGALGEERLVETLSQVPAPAFAHDQMVRLFYKYILVGGLPEAVKEYSNARDLPAVNRVYENLMTAYQDDIQKYARSSASAKVIRHCLSVAAHYAGGRIKFAGFGGSNYGSREIGEALRTLEQVRLLFLLYPTVAFRPPLSPSFTKSPRLQFIDTGLTAYLAGVQRELIEMDNLTDIYRGRIVEQLVAHEFMAADTCRSVRPVFWVREKAQASAEVDFLIQHGSQVIPVEVKAGSSGKLRSLHSFMRLQKGDLAVRLYRGEFQPQRIKHAGISYTLLNIPFYHASKIGDYLNHFLEKNGEQSEWLK